MDIEKILYDEGLLGTVTDKAEIEYIEKCIDDIQTEYEILKTLSAGIDERIAKWKSAFSAELEKSRATIESISYAAAEYSKCLSGDGIWGTVGDAEKIKSILRDYYGLVSNIDSLLKNGTDLAALSDNAREIFYKSIDVFRSARLFDIAARALDKNELSFASDFYPVMNEAEKSAEISVMRVNELTETETLIGKYISELYAALDAKNKGARMNATLARRLCDELVMTSREIIKRY